MTPHPDLSALAYDEATPAQTARPAGSSETWSTPEGIDIASSYEAEEADGVVPDSVPGFAPFGRGPYSTMYVRRPWTIRQYAGFCTAEESNAFYRRNLAAGQKGLSIAFDLATHRGYDSDHPRVSATSAWPGWRSTRSSTCEVLFDRIPLDG